MNPQPPLCFYTLGKVTLQQRESINKQTRVALVWRFEQKQKKPSTGLFFYVSIGCVINQRASVYLCVLLPHKYIIKYNIYRAGGTPTHSGGISAAFRTSLAQVVAIAIQT